MYIAAEVSEIGIVYIHPIPRFVHGAFATMGQYLQTDDKSTMYMQHMLLKATHISNDCSKQLWLINFFPTQMQIVTMMCASHTYRYGLIKQGSSDPIGPRVINICISPMFFRYIVCWWKTISDQRYDEKIVSNSKLRTPQPMDCDHNP